MIAKIVEIQVANSLILDPLFVLIATFDDSPVQGVSPEEDVEDEEVSTGTDVSGFPPSPLVL
jgi:hypothetical protein